MVQWKGTKSILLRDEAMKKAIDNNLSLREVVVDYIKLTNTEYGHNKFYTITVTARVTGKYSVYAHYGRISSEGKKLHIGDYDKIQYARPVAKKIERDKLRKGYKVEKREEVELMQVDKIFSGMLSKNYTSRVEFLELDEEKKIEQVADKKEHRRFLEL